MTQAQHREFLATRRGQPPPFVLAEQGAVLIALGALLGIGGSLAAAKFLEAFLFEVTASDPLSSVLAVLSFSAVTLGAALVPARRAAADGPAEVLRAE